MSFEVLRDLALGLDQEAQALPVAAKSRDRADCEGARIPGRREQARPAAEFVNPIGAPGEMIVFIVGGLQKRFAQFGIARYGRLASIQSLRGNFAGMVHAHQRGGFRPLGIVQIGRLKIRSRTGLGRPGRGCHDAQGGIQLGDQSIHHTEGTFIHGLIISRATPWKFGQESVRFALPEEG